MNKLSFVLFLLLEPFCCLFIILLLLLLYQSFTLLVLPFYKTLPKQLERLSGRYDVTSDLDFPVL